MSNEEVNFLVKMMLDEIMELFATVLPPKEAKEAMKGFIDDRLIVEPHDPLSHSTKFLVPC
jgi:hypothetical protein